ncbi:hypothetical protein D3C71_1144700 [compost metagenome]
MARGQCRQLIGKAQFLAAAGPVHQVHRAGHAGGIQLAQQCAHRGDPAAGGQQQQALGLAGVDGHRAKGLAQLEGVAQHRAMGQLLADLAALDRLDRDRQGAIGQWGRAVAARQRTTIHLHPEGDVLARLQPTEMPVRAQHQGDRVGAGRLTGDQPCPRPAQGPQRMQPPGPEVEEFFGHPVAGRDGVAAGGRRTGFGAHGSTIRTHIQACIQLYIEWTGYDSGT